MYTIVAVLHSGDGVYGEALVRNAATCIAALQQSVAALSPDFVPTTAILCADPYGGVQYVYSSAVPDSNHAVSHVNVYATADAGRSNSNSNAASGGGDGAKNDDERLCAAFAGRSTSLAVQSLLASARALSLRAHDGSNNNDNDNDNTTTTAQPRDRWACLAGALLACACFVHKHAAAATSGDDDGDAATMTSMTSLSSAAATRGCVLVFSDERDQDDDDAATTVSFAAECAFSVAVVSLVRLGLSVSCFGAAVAAELAREDAALAALSTRTDDNDAHTATTAAATAKATRDDAVHGVSGAARLRALAAACRGICAPAFSLDMLGRVLRMHDDDDNNDVDGKRGVEASSTRVHRTTPRERIAEQYLVAPTMLPRDAGQLARPGAATAANASLSRGLGWLCPRCMAIVQRDVREVHCRDKNDNDNDNDDDNDDEQQACAAVVCPYCAVDTR